MSYKIDFKFQLRCIIIILDRKRFQIPLGGNIHMGTLICQACNKIIDHFEDEKVSVLYSSCANCHKEQIEKENE